MAPEVVVSSLLPLSETRRLRGLLTEREHLARCRDAARHELRGANYSSDDRADCAAAVMLSALEETHGAPPRKNDQRHTLTVYCGKARNYRRGLDRERARDAAEQIAAEDRQAWSMVDAVESAEPLPEPITQAEAWELTDYAVKRLGADDIFGADLLIYRAMADVTSEVAAEQQELSHATYRQREHRAAKVIRERFGDALAMMQALIEVNPAPRIDAMTGERVWLVGYHDASRPATTHGKTIAGRMIRNENGEWRCGTDNGHTPIRAQTATEANELCSVGHRRSRKPKPMTDEAHAQMTADSLKRLGSALAAA